jgi:hypothetical protein
MMRSFFGRIFKGSGSDSESELVRFIQQLEAIQSEQYSSEEESAKLEQIMVTFLKKYPERYVDIKKYVDEKIDRTRIARQKLLQEETRTIDLSHFAENTRKKMGWPPTGSVRDLEGGSPRIKYAVEEIDRYGGKLPLREAEKIVAVLDPDSPEARYFHWEAEKNKGEE